MSKIYNVKNRSAGTVVYRIPEDGIRRTFQPGQVQKINFEELEKLTFQPGGTEILTHFLQLLDYEVIENLNIHTEPEYNMSEQDVINLLKEGSLDAFLDCLDFAPVGVIDLVKTYAVKLPLTDYDKRKALKTKTGFDVDAAVKNIELEKQEEESNDNTAAPVRRTSVSSTTEEPATTGRRTSGTTYKVLNISST